QRPTHQPRFATSSFPGPHSLKALLHFSHINHTSQLKITRRFRKNHFLSLLIGSGLLTSLILLYVGLFSEQDFRLAPRTTGLVTLEKRHAFPKLPVEKDMSPREVAALLECMTFVVSPGPPAVFRPGASSGGSFGAGVLVAAGCGGYVIATARHVIDGENWKSSTKLQRQVTIRSAEGDVATGAVLGRHKDLDLALLWVKRGTNGVDFCQVVKRSADVVVGEPVFAFGHPGGLLFSFTSGLVSGKRDGRQIQISVPISPGSSGGPLYDSRGRLLGIVSWSFDKSREPNAENLNFAVSMEDFTKPDQWRLTQESDKTVMEFLEKVNRGEPKQVGGDLVPNKGQTN
ncbi:MAG: serine protease, partial [Verrucomicrobia bacterium]|nr:serine protease [Verrucomicrobiota bacterium]